MVGEQVCAVPALRCLINNLLRLLLSPPAAAGAPPPRRFHVGDTPQDILAALAAGATARGVATGIDTKAQLEAVAPGGDVVVLDGLLDGDRFMQVLGL